MHDETQVTKVYDLKGLSCPIPILKVSKLINEVQIGEIIEAQVSDRGSLNDFPSWAENSGNEILKIQEEADFIRYFIKRLV